MQKSRPTKRSAKARSTKSLIVRLDDESKRYLTQAAGLRCISVSDYVRQVTVAQGKREIHADEQGAIPLTAEVQLALWNALNAPVELTGKQRELGRLMQGMA